MRAHRNLWVGWHPSTAVILIDWLGVVPVRDSRTEEITKACVEQMKRDGVISQSTSWRDVSIEKYACLVIVAD